MSSYYITLRNRAKRHLSDRPLYWYVPCNSLNKRTRFNWRTTLVVFASYDNAKNSQKTLKITTSWVIMMDDNFFIISLSVLQCCLKGSTLNYPVLSDMKWWIVFITEPPCKWRSFSFATNLKTFSFYLLIPIVEMSRIHLLSLYSSAKSLFSPF